MQRTAFTDLVTKSVCSVICTLAIGKEKIQNPVKRQQNPIPSALDSFSRKLLFISNHHFQGKMTQTHLVFCLFIPFCLSFYSMSYSQNQLQQPLVNFVIEIDEKWHLMINTSHSKEWHIFLNTILGALMSKWNSRKGSCCALLKICLCLKVVRKRN